MKTHAAVLILAAAGNIVGNFVANFVEKSDKSPSNSTKFPTKFPTKVADAVKMRTAGPPASGLAGFSRHG